jgi:hypothetical protein
VFAQIPGVYESSELVPQQWVTVFQDTLATARVPGVVA